MAALTSLLVRDHVVSVHKIEEALQQQVLEGGEIDTVLLELGAAPEDVLSAYRAATFGLTPATRQEVMSAQGEALLALPKEVAEHFRLVPIALREQVLIVATSKPLPDAAVDELKKKLKLELEFCIATEVRVETALAVHYGIEISGRMRRLADELEKCEPGALPKVDPLGEGMGAQHERNIVDEFWATSPVKEPSDDARETTGNPSVPTQAGWVGCKLRRFLRLLSCPQI
jgi:hypothetical protein